MPAKMKIVFFVSQFFEKNNVSCNHVRNRIIPAKMIHIKSIQNFKTFAAIPHGIFDSPKENFFQPTAWKFSQRDIGNRDIF